MKKYIDLGANKGNVFKKHYKAASFDEYHLFEPNKALYEKYIRSLSRFDVHVYEQAAWTSNGMVNFYIGSQWDGEGSTLLENKTTGRIDYDNPDLVYAIDISEFVGQIYNDGDEIYLKIDVEGAEYDILEHMFDRDTLKFIDTLDIEFHSHKFKNSLKVRHDKIIERLETLGTKIILRTT